jgi:hypothetical protein
MPGCVPKAGQVPQGRPKIALYWNSGCAPRPAEGKNRRGHAAGEHDDFLLLFRKPIPIRSTRLVPIFD